MFNSLELFQTASAMARHAGSRQAIVARNIANADTPGFEAQHIPAFKDAYDANAAYHMRSTRAGHLPGRFAGGAQATPSMSTTEPSPNGNTVSLEEELLNSVAVSREHNRALAVYRHTMTVLRMTLGRT